MLTQRSRLRPTLCLRGQGAWTAPGATATSRADAALPALAILDEGVVAASAHDAFMNPRAATGTPSDPVASQSQGNNWTWTSPGSRVVGSGLEASMVTRW